MTVAVLIRQARKAGIRVSANGFAGVSRARCNNCKKLRLCVYDIQTDWTACSSECKAELVRKAIRRAEDAVISESMTCETCGTKTLIVVRSIEDTFWCDACKQWKPCHPVAAWKDRERLKTQT